MLKTEFGLDSYPLKLNKGYIISIYKLCTFNFKLPIETGRLSNVPIHERICTLCSENKIGDEFHYLFEIKNPEIKKLELWMNH